MSEQDETKVLSVQSPSRKKPRAGDVFALQLKRGGYLLGVVVDDSMKLGSIEGMRLIYIYRGVFDEMPAADEVLRKSTSDLLIPPKIINDLGWSRGYFRTIGHVPLDQLDTYREHVFKFHTPSEKRWFDGKSGERRPDPGHDVSNHAVSSYAFLDEVLSTMQLS